ncbi:ankyrin [Gonapodya prolifera JEL478]|uniref:Ankyrin n=1 Tax=Gonapodya prolifera (strain JEL478) TaxID=1344416 RepID=A0A139A2F0_GONPJ|nr:ankyrin [Gonapodya prolifera JEL478]|eukprot:KXS10957.1 ankyrin [Gonapodya prolifera JEL478]
MPYTDLSLPSPASSHFRLLALPTEIIHRVGIFCTDSRLAYPTPALNRHLHSVFSTPQSIASRALRHYPSPESALLAESTLGNPPVLAILCRHANLNVPALRRAARGGHLGAVECLLDAGIDPNAGENNYAIFGARPDGYALWTAVNSSNTEIVELLLLDGSAVGPDAVPCPQAILYSAVQYGHAETARLLLQHVPSAHENKDGLVLHAAARGFADVVRVLLDSGTDLDLNNREAVRAAAENGHEGVLQVFRERGLELDEFVIEARRGR